ncbi:NAD(P)H-binding protein [Aequorivita marina]|uniref:NAD(P)H-binding protein n=1 Tax=Aequorivita marina TaxID=3073654 RepID=UPI0028748177|nr:NAD(P)H-binding protein [Aequorivita sp. S2608]MDS1297514.1 NAD(P)H-binding protein [Aequorivita sp. S2608]
MNKTIAIAGLGWLGQALAFQLANLGYTLKGSVTTVEKAKMLQKNGFDAYAMEISDEGVRGQVKALLNGVGSLIIMIPPGLRRNTGADYVLKMTHFLEEIKMSAVQKIILVSSTSVYDDSQGNVTEKDDPKPQTIAGKQLRQVEELFINTDAFKTTVVRFGGLFGGSRNPAKYLAGRSNLRGGEAPVNLIHRDDCINILAEILKQDTFGNVFNAVNPDHPKKSDYYIQKATEMGLEPPSFVDSDPDEIFKQVDSDNLKGVLAYGFKSGLN